MITTELLARAYGTEGTLKLAKAGKVGPLEGVAAAALLLSMIDSHRVGKAKAEFAKQRLQPVIDQVEERPGLRVDSQRDFQRGPRVFVAADGADEDSHEYYRAGFMPRVPMGMDQGMVRLASEEGLGSSLRSLFGEKVASMMGPPKTTVPSVTPPAGGKPGQSLGRKALGFAAPIAVAGVGSVGLNAGAKKVLDYGEKETVTPWGMAPYGGTRLNTQLNDYGQPTSG